MANLEICNLYLSKRLPSHDASLMAVYESPHISGHERFWNEPSLVD